MLTITLIVFPLLVSLVLFALNGRKGFKTLAIGAALVELIIAGIALATFDKSIPLNFGSSFSWIPSTGISFTVGMDGISLMMVLLTALLIPVIVYVTSISSQNYSSAFYGLILLMQSALIGVFTVRDGLVFYIFWEMALIPIYFICALWGGENRVRITLKFFIYTMLGSLFMLAVLIWMYLSTPLPHSFDITVLTNRPYCSCMRVWLFAGLFLAFAIKIPIFPFHSWQPDTYTNAPAPGSMLLAGIMLKMGLYGLIRFNLPVGGDVLTTFNQVVIPLGLIGLLYGSIIAIRQKEIKRLIAYSSFAHVGLMAVAILAATADSLTGSVYQMLSHGVNVVALFFIAEIISTRTQTTQIADLGGIARVAPRFATVFMVVMLGSVALPLTNGFIGEFLMLVGIAQYSLIISAIAGVSIILGAVYMFWMYQRTMYGETKPATETFADLTTREMVVAVPLVILVIAMGVYPKPLLEIIKPAVDVVLNNMIIR